ncbi:hypothetical protein [Sulfuracidifex metallicus]|nr:hypothetical protein [Sulfuracidifex metallicus]
MTEGVTGKYSTGVVNFSINYAHVRLSFISENPIFPLHVNFSMY